MQRRFRTVALVVSLMFFGVLGVAVETVFQRAEVLRVRDGDTIDVEFEDGTRDTIRYSGISAPEEEDCIGDNAEDVNRELVEGKMVWLEKGLDDGEYIRGERRRILAYVWLDPDRTLLVQQQLVQSGYARVDPYQVKDTEELFSTLYADQLIEAQIQAAFRRTGWWGQCDSYREADFIIAAVKYWSNLEIVFLINRGDAPVNLGAGWVLKDETESERNTLVFREITGSSCIVPPAGIVKIYSGHEVPENQRRTFTPCNKDEINIYWTGNKIWGNRGDVARLFDQNGELVHRYVYPPFSGR